MYTGKNQKNGQCQMSQGFRKVKTITRCWWGCRLVYRFWGTIQPYKPKELDIYYDPGILLLGITSSRNSLIKLSFIFIKGDVHGYIWKHFLMVGENWEATGVW